MALGTRGGGVHLLREGRAPLFLSTDAGIPWRYIGCLAFAGDRIWVGTVGGGVAFVDDASSDAPHVTALPQGPKVHRYVSGLAPLEDGGCLVATGDGLLEFTGSGALARARLEHHFGGQSLTTVRCIDGRVLVGTLRGPMEVTRDAARPLAGWDSSPAARRVRDIAQSDGAFWFATDAGVWRTEEIGDPPTALSPEPTRALLARPGGGVLAATSRGIVMFDSKGHVESVRASAGGSLASDVYGMATTEAGLVAATGAGLARVAEATAPSLALAPAAATAPALSGAWPFLKLARPVAREDQPYPDQTYLFGTTAGGIFPAHQGIDINLPWGAPLRAVAPGHVVRVTGPDVGNRIWIRHETVVDGWRLHTVTVHAREVLVREGARVQTGDVLALAGEVGRATNVHLHFEVRWLREGDSLDASLLSNPELWLEPVDPTCGAIAMELAAGECFVGPVKPLPADTPYHSSESPSVARDSGLPGATCAFAADVPAGEHDVWIAGERRRIVVRAGAITWVMA